MHQPIPVVSLGARRQQAVGTAQADVNGGDVSSHPPPNRRQEAASRRPSHPRPVSSRGTAVIGTSMINGLGQQLNKLGIPATTFMYRGATVPVLQNRVQHILNCRNQPERIVLQCGGNDAEQQPAIVISARIETLVHDIKRLSPGSDILINKIPPRGRNQKVLNNIEKINSAQERIGIKMMMLFRLLIFVSKRLNAIVKILCILIPRVPMYLRPDLLSNYQIFHGGKEKCGLSHSTLSKRCDFFP